jgi:acyl-CoA synthetase (AMP-forming)/AMP-acid ligase II
MMILRPSEHRFEDEAKLKSCGRPLPLIQAKIIDSDGKELPDCEIGEIVVRSPGIFRGYKNQPEATAAVLRHGWYATGDAGYRDRDGLYFIVDRVKDMILTGGENVYSVEVERALVQHPCVAQAAVVGVPDVHWGEAVKAFVVLRAGTNATEEELIAYCRERIARYKVPKSVVITGHFPTTSSGKVLKRQLRELR